jgi:two-component system LytT family response regulator
MLIASKNEWHVVAKVDVAYFQADGNYTKLFMKDKSLLLTSKTLKHFSELLGIRFLRVHQSFLVNPIYISSFNQSLDQLTLRSGEQIPISRSKRKLVRAFMNRYYD